MVAVGVPLQLPNLDPRADRWAVAGLGGLAAALVPALLDDLRVVDVRAELVLHGGEVGTPAVCGELDPVRQTGVKS